MGVSGRIARYFLESRLTPLVALVALLLGAFAIVVTPREEEPQINVTMANVIVPFPGASARRRFDVMTAATTVPMRLSLKLFAVTTSKGRRKPGPDPAGSGRDAHQISPRRTTACLGL